MIAADRIVFVVAEMIAHLRIKRGLRCPLGQLSDQPVWATAYRPTSFFRLFPPAPRAQNFLNHEPQYARHTQRARDSAAAPITRYPDRYRDSDDRGQAMWERVNSLLGRLDKIPGYRTGGYLSGFLIYLSDDLSGMWPINRNL